MKKTLLRWLLALALTPAFPAARQALAQDPCVSARFNDFSDAGCHQTPGGPGAPASGAAGAGGNSAYCPTCYPAGGMPRWWVDEPYINLHLVDEPLSYATSSGQKIAFRFHYRQRASLPGLDQVPSQIIPFLASPNPNRIADDFYVNTLPNHARFHFLSGLVKSSPFPGSQRVALDSHGK